MTRSDQGKENVPNLWKDLFPFPSAESHKYSRGAALVRGGPVMTGAARLAARAAQRAGAGLVTIAAPRDALPVYAKSLESVIVRPCDTADEWQLLIEEARRPALLIGPGLGSGRKDEVLKALAVRRPTVVDADALTCFAEDPSTLFDAVHADCVLTPHEGEFTRVFGSVGEDRRFSVLAAAGRAGCVVLLKGSETVVASPDGRLILNTNASPWLATAGSGDVLAGIILGLIAQKMPVFEATAAGAWIHGRSGSLYGPGLIAEDIVCEMPFVLREIADICGKNPFDF